MQTSQGTFELKSFFTSSVAGADGGTVSSTAVRKRIREIVASENPAKPLSDAAIAQTLEKEGICVARRTVAKYRELGKHRTKAVAATCLISEYLPHRTRFKNWHHTRNWAKVGSHLDL